MEPISFIASSLIGLINQGRKNKLIQDQLNETKRTNRETERLAKADRTDQYGNVIKYIEGLGFQTEVTALTQAILDGQQFDQHQQFTNDAPRQRAAFNRQDDRSIQANDIYGDLVNDYTTRRRETEAEARSRSVLETLDKREHDSGVNNLITQALRLGNSGAIQGIVDASKSGSTIASAIAEGNRNGTQEFLQTDAARKQNELSEMNAFLGIANNAPNAQLTFGSSADGLQQTADQSLQGLISLLQNNTRNEANIASQKDTSIPMDFANIFAQLAQVSGAGSSGRDGSQNALLNNDKFYQY